MTQKRNTQKLPETQAPAPVKLTPFQNAAVNAGLSEEQAAKLPAECPADRNALSTAVRQASGLIRNDLKEAVDYILSELNDVTASSGGEQEAPAATMSVAGPGETAVQTEITKENPFGLAAATYTGCSRCEYNLDAYSKKHRIPLASIKICPNPVCQVIFVAERTTVCYACSTNMPATGSCVSCGAKSGDPEDLKIATIEARRTNSKLDGIAAQGTARTIYMLNPAGMAILVANARVQNWIRQVEEEGVQPAQLGQESPSDQRPFRATNEPRKRETF